MSLVYHFLEHGVQGEATISPKSCILKEVVKTPSEQDYTRSFLFCIYKRFVYK